MQNVNVKVEGRKLILEIDLDVDLGLSSTGNSNFVAKTGGWQKLGVEDLSMNLNLTRVLPKAERMSPGAGSYSRRQEKPRIPAAVLEKYLKYDY